MPFWTTPLPGAVGQRIKAGLFNLAVQAIQELQAAVPGMTDYRPQLRVYAPASVTNGAVVPYASVRKDTHSGWSSINYTYTTPLAGLYLVQIQYKAGASAVSPAQNFQVGGAGQLYTAALPSGGYIGGHLSGVIDLPAGAVCRVVENNATYTPQNDSAGTYGTGSNYLHITYLGLTT